MFTKTNRLMFVLRVSLLVVLAAIFSLPVQVSAQTAGSTDNSCLTCHEDLYYFHDTGKLYCLTNHIDRCTNCHEGSAATMKKEESHLGLIAHPQENNGVKCLECHTAQDAQTRLVTFESKGGFDTVIKAEPYTPSVEAGSGFPEIAKPLIEWKWAAGASILFGLWLLLVLFSPLKP
jgi:hypothetical protein